MAGFYDAEAGQLQPEHGWWSVPPSCPERPSQGPLMAPMEVKFGRLRPTKQVPTKAKDTKLKPGSKSGEAASQVNALS